MAAPCLSGGLPYLGLATTSSASVRPGAPDAYSPGATYAPDGTAGKTAAVPRADVRILSGRFLGNEQRNLAYLLFLDPDRMLRSFRVNYGLPTAAAPVLGWEAPNSRIRGHVTGHLMSALAWAYAGTGTTASDPGRLALKAKGDYLVAQLASMQAMAPTAGYGQGYLSAFQEQYFTWLEGGEWNRIWSPYYMIHKYLAGLIDQYQLAGNAQALDVAVRLADWVDRRTRNLTYQHMQKILNVEFGGLPEALANLYAITGDPATLNTAERFYHASFLDPLAANVDNLNGQQCNVSTPKVISALRLAEETGNEKYWNAAVNFWNIATAHHSYAIGGQGNFEHWGPPDTVAGTLSNYNCEGCVSYNMLKLTRLLHFHDPGNAAYMDYYERTLVNHLLGIQDQGSPHGFVTYYTGLSPGAHKQVPVNYFPGADENVFATNYDTFTCDTATGIETPARFTDTIYTTDPDGALRVNLFIPSRVHANGLTIRQVTSIPDAPLTILAVEAVSGRSGAGRWVRPVRYWPAGYWADHPAGPRARLGHHRVGHPERTTSAPDLPAGGGRGHACVAARRRAPGHLRHEPVPATGARQPPGRRAGLRSRRAGRPDRGPNAHAGARPVFRPAGIRVAPGLRNHGIRNSGRRPRHLPDPGLRRGPPALHHL